MTRQKEIVRIQQLKQDLSPTSNRPYSQKVEFESKSSSFSSNSNGEQKASISMVNGISSTIATERNGSLKKQKTAAISDSSLRILKFCFSNSHEDTAYRIILRMAHKRHDFAIFCGHISEAQFQDLVEEMKVYLLAIFDSVENEQKIIELSYAYGKNQVKKRLWGFKANFFAAIADAIATEGVYLDLASHDWTETIEAWVELVDMMLSAVRDGFYEQTRQLRYDVYCKKSDNHPISIQTQMSDRQEEISSLSSESFFTLSSNRSQTSEDASLPHHLQIYDEQIVDILEPWTDTVSSVIASDSATIESDDDTDDMQSCRSHISKTSSISKKSLAPSIGPVEKEAPSSKLSITNPISIPLLTHRKSVVLDCSEKPEIIRKNTSLTQQDIEKKSNRSKRSSMRSSERRYAQEQQQMGIFDFLSLKFLTIWKYYQIKKKLSSFFQELLYSTEF